MIGDVHVIDSVDTCLSMGDPASKKPWLQFLKAVRVIILIPILMYITLVALGVYVASAAQHSKCPKSLVVSVKLLACATFFRLIWLIINGCIQARTASVMNAVEPGPISVHGRSGSKSGATDRRQWFRRWRWWNHLGTLVLIFQVVAACLIVRNNDQVEPGSVEKRLEILLMILPVAGLAVVVFGWFMGSEVMSWRALYTSNDAWKAHYSEAFRSYIRQALCCMGRYRYLVKKQDGEVFSVASLLGELVSYRAEGCSHLEVIGGVSLLLRDKEVPVLSEKKEPVPEHVIPEASIFHRYAVAAYTGPLLEIGRYPYCFFLPWLYSQGCCSFWKIFSRPILKGDNLFRGHAAAFVRHARLTPEDVLSAGRVLQTDRESAYFVVILKELQTIVVAVRGTETLEDLLTDGLSRETTLSDADWLDFRKGPQDLNEFESRGKHYAHSGIVEAARKLAEEIDKDDDGAATEGGREKGLSRGGGLLTKLLGPKGTHKNYDLRFVGHSLGGSICALTGLREEELDMWQLYRRYPQLRVYAYGLLPCVDEHLAEACKDFVTSVVCHDEFATRLSVASIVRLRARALQALSDDTKRERAQGAYANLGGEVSSGSNTDKSSSASSRFSHLFSSDSQSTDSGTQSPLPSGMKKWSDLRKTQRLPYMFRGGLFLCAHTCFCMFRMSQHHRATVISSEVKRYVEWMTSERQKTTAVNVESMTRLNPPIPLALQGSSPMTGLGEGQFDAVDLEMQSYENGWRGGFNDESWLIGSNLEQSEIPMEMGSGFETISSEAAGAKLKELNPVEMYLPGLVLHLQKEENRAVSWWASFWNSWQAERNSKYRVVLADRMKFQDLVISPSMFIDHMPWKCQYALNSILSELQKGEGSGTAVLAANQALVC